MQKSDFEAGRTRRAPNPSGEARAESPWVPRDAFERCVKIAAARGESGVPHALFVLHVERLDDIASACGPDAEAAVLDLIALVLTNLTGNRFPYCRLDPHRLAVIKSHCVPSNSPTVARQIRTSLQGGVFIWHGRHFRLGVSVGAAVLLPENGGTGGLIDRAWAASIAARDLGNQGYLMLDGSAGEKARIDNDRAWLEHLSETIV